MSANGNRGPFGDGVRSRLTPDEVRIYSALCSPPVGNEPVDQDHRLVELFDGASRRLEFRSFIQSVESGTVYDHYRRSFDPTQGVDEQLVLNLRAARQRMSKGARAPNLPTIHRLLARVLFTCYLEARHALTDRDFGMKRCIRLIVEN